MVSTLASSIMGLGVMAYNDIDGYNFGLYYSYGDPYDYSSPLDKNNTSSSYVYYDEGGITIIQHVY